MRGLERAMEWLRTLVDSKAWDYCVVWKLGDDSSRFIEWMGCCCSGAGVDGEDMYDKVRKERGEEKDLAPFCRDVCFQHSVRTKACEALAQFPTFLPLHSRIHGEAAITTQARWLQVHANNSDSSAPPVAEDQSVIELIKRQCTIGKEEAMILRGYSSGSFKHQEHCLDPQFEENLQSSSISFHLVPPIPYIPALSQPDAYAGFEGSSGSSNPPNEHSLFDAYSGRISQNDHLSQSLRKSSLSRKSKHNDYSLKAQGGKYKAKNLITERNRRIRIRDRLHVLRALVPKISKMDKASILVDAIDYIGELREEVNKLKDELKEIGEEECREPNAEMELETKNLKVFHQCSSHLTLSKSNQDSSGFQENIKSEFPVEVSQIGKRYFLIKLFCEWKQGGFGKLMKVLNSIGIQVLDANITTFNGKVLDILKVKAREGCSTREIERVIDRTDAE